MKLFDAIKVISPLDVISLTIETQEIVKKESLDDCLPASFLLKKAEELIMLGEFPTRNITYWNATEGLQKNVFPDWEERLISVLTNSNMILSVQNLDNTKSVMKISCEIFMLAHNCAQLTNESLKGVICAKVNTAFGTIDVEI